MKSLSLDDRRGLDEIRGIGASDGRDGRGASLFESVYEAHYRDVARYVLLRTRGRDDTEEIVAETFTRAFAAWRAGRGPAGRPLPWLLVIARRITTDRWRRQRIIAWAPIPGIRSSIGGSLRHGRDESEPRASDTDTIAREFWLWFDALSRELPARQREVLLLRYRRDLSDEEIGEILEISASGVRTLASRALNKLRSHPELWA
jgi:RNA polymerase sigma factor (sigma-70 family)